MKLFRKSKKFMEITKNGESIPSLEVNFEASNLVFLKTYNTEFDEIIITFTDQNETGY